jgi:AraC-like DNA-binding protein
MDATAQDNSPHSKEKVVLDAYAQMKNWSVEKLIDESMNEYQRGNYDKAVLCLTLVTMKDMDKLSDADRAECVKAYNNLSLIYSYNLFNYPKAMECCEAGRKLAKRYHVPKYLPVLYLTYAGIMLGNDNIHNQHKPNMKTFELYKEGFNEAVKQNDWTFVHIAVNNVTNNALLYNRLDIAMPIIKEYNKLNVPSSAYLRDFTRLQNAGMMAVYQKDYQKALKFFEQAIEAANEKNSAVRGTDVVAYSNLARTYALMGDYENAIRNTQKMLQIEREENMQSDIIYTYYEMSEYYRKSGNAPMSKDYYVKYLSAKDSFLTSSGILDAERVKFSNDMQDMNVQLQTITTKKKAQSVIIYLLIIILLIVAVTGILLYRNYKKLGQKNKQLFLSYQELLKEDTNRKLVMEREAENAEHKSNAEKESAKYQKNSLSEEEKEKLAHDILGVMENVDMICAEDFSLQQLAEETDSRRNNVSQVINEVLHKSFSSLLAEYRVKEACRRLNDGSYDNYTIEAIAQSVGYKSRSSFVSLFKKLTGLSPSEYQKIARQEKLKTA